MAASSILMSKETLPDAIVDIIAILSCDTFQIWARSWRGVARRFMSLSWYSENVRSDFVEVHSQSRFASLQEGMRQTVLRSLQVLIVHPGTYRESLRVTRNLLIVGWGNREDVIIDAPGWEPALVFAGLGTNSSHNVMGVSGKDTGDRAAVCNLTLCGRNQHQAVVAHIVRGQPSLCACNVHGCIFISGSGTGPSITRCHIRSSRSSGIRVTDHSSPFLQFNLVTHNSGYGVHIDRGSAPILKHNIVTQNGIQNIAASEGSAAVLTMNEIDSVQVILEMRRDLIKVSIHVKGIIYVNEQDEHEWLHGE
ncbi:hypothetical protein CYMTET_21610 [Cymbomonas tetramitiformis]|uniref:Right handed beta helix domain-containing protein n=1 Tax=Cymbomonas tetramitiformis TaxID=36881 RepID=A0AAE0G1U0_9CHLO|nr:hypothetical protein CYMTET_21610 [Cymbomonas tetramitiformis]